LALVGVVKVAKALNVTTRRVQQLADEGMPREGRGKYDLAQCMLWYIRYLQNAISNRDGNGADAAGNDLKAQRTRLITAQAAREEIALRREQGELVPIADYEETMAAHITSVRQRLLSMPANIAHHLEGEDRESIKQKLESEMRNVLASIAGSE
jgi:phage terminase Nu1 subunit (DNA packaging protein)